jgi:hypothetical protein
MKAQFSTPGYIIPVLVMEFFWMISKKTIPHYTAVITAVGVITILTPI